MLTVGALLQYGKYRIDDVLAVKGSSATYQATQCDLSRSVVIKTVVAEYLAVKVGIGRFLAEARRLAELQHPHIVRVGDCFVEQGRLFLVTDFLYGQSLAQKVAQGPIPAADAMRYVRQVGQAVASMHQQGLLHRDIKPSNIMVSEDQRSATLADFNIARSLHVTPIDQSASTTNSVSNQAQAISNSLGTEFIAPELTLSPHLWTAAADVYALAATLYALVTGKAPTGSWRNVLREEQIFERTPALGQAILTGMAIERSDRPASLSEWLPLLPQNDLPIPLEGHTNLERTDSAPANLVLKDSVHTDLVLTEPVQADSTPDPAPAVINDLDPTLAVLEHPHPLNLQPASNRNSQSAAQISPKRSGRRTQRASFTTASRPTRFPRKALLLSAIASGVGGIAFGVFMKTQIFSAIVLPSSLSDLTPPETIQETFPPKSGSQVSGAQSEPPSVESPVNELDPAGTAPIVPDVPASAGIDAAPPETDVVIPTSPLPKTSDSDSNPTTKSPADASHYLDKPYPEKDIPISSPTNSTDPSFDATNPNSLEPLPPSGGTETLPAEHSSAPLPSTAEPTLP
jgi:serine/threonine protein kinase